MASKMYPFINYRDSIHYRNSCSATIVIVKFLLSLSTTHCYLNSSKRVPVKLVHLRVKKSPGGLMGGVVFKLYKAVNNYMRNGILRVFYYGEDASTLILQWLANGFDSDYMLSRLVVSLIIFNICGVRLLCLYMATVLVLVYIY